MMRIRFTPRRSSCAWLVSLTLAGCTGEAADSSPVGADGGASGNPGSGGSGAIGATGGTGAIGVDAGGSSGSGGAAGQPTTCVQAAQARSYVGCDFWPTVTFNPVYPNFDFAAVVANAGSEPAQIEVERGGTAIATASVDPGALAEIPLPWVDALKGPYFGPLTTGGRVKQSVRVDGGAYHLTSDRPITVWQFNPLEYTLDPATCAGYFDGEHCLSVSNDAALLLPSTAMTGAYRFFGRSAVNGGEEYGSTPGAFTITATEDGTNVDVTLTANLASGPGVAAGSAGETLSFAMNAGDVIELLGAWGPFWGDPHSDMSGSVLIADKPVALIASNPLSNVPDENSGFADHMEETVLPGEALGKRYLVSAPTAPDGRVVGHTLRFYGNVAATTLSYPSGNMPAGAPVTLAAGQVVEIGPVLEPFEVTADQAFAVASFMLGGQKQDPAGGDFTTRGDPAFSMLVTPEQFRTHYTFLAPNDYLENYADVVLPDGAVVTLDGQPLGGAPEPIGSSGWSVVRVRLGAGREGAHTLDSDKAVGLQVMGFGHATAYYYPGGLDVKLIAPPPIPG